MTKVSAALAALVLTLAPGGRVAAQQGSAPAGMVYIPGGTFTMGSPATEADRDADEVQRVVVLTSFYMGKYEVTQKEYQAVMGTNPSSFKGGDLPVEGVSWYDALEYCNLRSLAEGLTPAYTINKTGVDPYNTSTSDKLKWAVAWNRYANGYRLPTEAEWEYACRAGTTTPFSTGANITTAQANYNGSYPYAGNAAGVNRLKTIMVGTFAPNPWGLYDMHGNVWEWCWDWCWNYDTTIVDGRSDPVGPYVGSSRVNRGGSWLSYGKNLRSANQGGSYPSYKNYDVGFRVVRPLM